MEHVDIVNENDEIVSSASMEECHKKGLLHRSVEVFVFRDGSLSELLIQRRGVNGEVLPGRMCGSAGGHLRRGDSYLEGANRELEEELFVRGLPKSIKLIEVVKFKMNDFPGNNEIKTLYYTIYSGPFDWNREEIAEEPVFVKIEDLVADVKNNPERYTECFKITLEKFLNRMPDM
jgi:isopentenyl-diphosphate delta-isomerase